MAEEKKVVEEVTGCLQVFNDGSVERRWSGPPEARFLVQPVPPSPNAFLHGVATRDLVIHPESRLSVRQYLPQPKSDDPQRLPVLLHFHGGGFCFSGPDWHMYHQFYARLVASTRALCVSVYLRLAPEHRLPAAVDDGYAALLWLRSLARAELSDSWLGPRADFSRVFLIGDSSGGNLVHEVATRASRDDLLPLQLAGGLLLHPGFVREKRSQSELELPGSAFINLEMIDKLLLLALPAGSTKDHPVTCPMGWNAPPMGELRLPPFLVALAERDLMRETQMEYVEQMKKSGKEVKTVISAGVEHCFYLNKIAIDSDPHVAAQTDALIAAISDFVASH